MYEIIIISIFCISDILANLLQKNNSLSAIFNALAVATGITSICYFITEQFAGRRIADTLSSSRIYIAIFAVIIIEIIIKIRVRGKNGQEKTDVQ